MAEKQTSGCVTILRVFSKSIFCFLMIFSLMTMLPATISSARDRGLSDISVATSIETQAKFVRSSYVSAIHMVYNVKDLLSLLIDNDSFNVNDLIKVEGIRPGDIQIDCRSETTSCLALSQEPSVDLLNNLYTTPLQIDVSYL